MAEAQLATGRGADRGRVRRSARAALMPYMMGGFPSLAESLEVGRGLRRAGADLIELGVPFSDPLADGPAIQAAGQRALEAGATLREASSTRSPRRSRRRSRWC